MSERPDEDLAVEIDREEARLAEIESEREAARARIAALRGRFAAAQPSEEPRAAAPIVAATSAPTTTASKVALFRSLFRGREDVFPRLWQNPRAGRKGYAPACSNEWVRRVCEKPRVKCGECQSQAFIPIVDRVLLDHLQGKHVMGVYPLLKDETCWFLAVDFDGTGWTEDVAAFAATCRGLGLSPAVERSRSGNGAHAWFFFSGPVPSAEARRMACHLITETMDRRDSLPMTSYDRLFPNQDTMPKGGFGNLIALPLQHQARAQWNTVFLDDRMEPYSDQWAFLAQVPRLEPRRVEEIADEAARRGRIMGLRACAMPDEPDPEPWTRPASGRPLRDLVDVSLPEKVRAVLGQRLFVEKEGLPPALLNRIKRLAAFQNPEFYKKQAMRLSTATTPRVIACAEESSHHVALPRGCLADLKALLDENGIGLGLEDHRSLGEPIEAKFHGRLTSPQKEAAQALLAEEIGVFVAPPGAGKTVVGAYLIAERGRNALVLVHRKPLLDQWVARLSAFLGIPAKEIGRIGGGRKKRTGRIDVAMIQSLGRKGAVADLVGEYGHVVVDECHHVPAVSFDRVLSEAKARYITGLTATPYRRDGHQPIIEMQCGPVRHAITPRRATEVRPFVQHLVVRETRFRAPAGATSGIQALYAALAADEARSDLILDDVIAAVEEGRSPVVLTERRDHLDYLAEKLGRCVRNTVVLRGGMGARERKKAIEQLAAVPEGEDRLLLATGRYLGEGFDDARLDTLFLALPVSWRGTLVQYAGRLQRPHAGKTEVRIYDYVDRDVSVLLRMFDRRLRGYRAIGFAEGPSGPVEGQPRQVELYLPSPRLARGKSERGAK